MPQSRAYVIERLGSYYATWNQGVHFKVPFIDRVAANLSLKEDVSDLEPQHVITKDNVTMEIDALIATTIIDPKAATYGVENLDVAVDKSVGTALRNVIGEIDLDEALSQREKINAKMQTYMDEVTAGWGIKVNRVELKNITPPQNVKDTMERQMTAERDRRAKVTSAQADKEAALLDAEADAESDKKKAEGEAAAQITAAQAKAKSIQIEAEAKANAIKTVQQAYADGLADVANNHQTDAYLKLQAMDALAKVANGNATKLIVPSELQDLAVLNNMWQADKKDK